MNRTIKLISMLLPVVVLGLGATAQAQDTPPPAETPPPPPPAQHRSSSGGDGAGIGVGATSSLTTNIPGAGGPYLGAGNFVYDTGLFHVEGIFGFASAPAAAGADDRNSIWQFGAGGWYHFHKGSSSDFSLGGAVLINYISGPGGSNTLTSFEPGAMARGFLTPNMAIFARMGLALLLGDSAPGGGANFYIGGQPALVAGYTYFFR
jgi:hypothetical protein